MKLIIPQVIQINSINVADDTTPLWDSAITYNTGDIVRVQNLGVHGIDKLFESLADNNTGNYPPDNPDVWGDLGGTNKYKFLDEYVNTQTVLENDNLTMQIQATQAEVLAFFNVTANSITVSGTDYEGNSWSKEIDMRIFVDTWYDYFFAPIEFKKDAYIELPIATPQVIDITFDGGGSNTGVGLIVLGKAYYLGDTQFGVRPGIRDFSIKDTDSFGKTYLKQGDFSKQVEFDLWLENWRVDEVIRRLEQVRGTACVWQVNNEYTQYESLLVYGFFDDFDPVLKGPAYTSMSIRVEGLI